jgi:hypothetical protein
VGRRSALLAASKDPDVSLAAPRASSSLTAALQSDARYLWHGSGFFFHSGAVCGWGLSADLVTAEGKLVTASARENDDLFRGLRGGGGNFGVVTSFEFQLHRVGEILGGMVPHAIDDAPDVIAFVAVREQLRTSWSR